MAFSEPSLVICEVGSDGRPPWSGEDSVLGEVLDSHSARGLHCLFQIHLYTRGCHSDQNLGHLSVTEAEMLRDPEGGQKVRAGKLLPEWAWAAVGSGGGTAQGGSGL